MNNFHITAACSFDSIMKLTASANGGTSSFSIKVQNVMIKIIGDLNLIIQSCFVSKIQFWLLLDTA
jgi:hypothetical protein